MDYLCPGYLGAVAVAEAPLGDEVEDATLSVLIACIPVTIEAPLRATLQPYFSIANLKTR